MVRLITRKPFIRAVFFFTFLFGGLFGIVGVAAAQAAFTIGSVTPTTATEGAVPPFKAVVAVGGVPSVASCALWVDGASQGGMVRESTGSSFTVTPCVSGETCTAVHPTYSFPPGSAGTPHSAFVRCADTSSNTVDGAVTPITVTAAGPPPPPPPAAGGAFASLTVSGLIAILESIGDWIFAIGMLIAVIMVIIGATMFLTGGGDPSGLGTGKKILLWAGLGVGLMLLARGVFAVLRSILGA